MWMEEQLARDYCSVQVRWPVFGNEVGNGPGKPDLEGEQREGENGLGAGAGLS